MSEERKNELLEKIAPLRAELEKIAAEERAAENISLVGTYYKTPNSYSNTESWWLYVAITGTGEHCPTGFQFQKKLPEEWEIRRLASVTRVRVAEYTQISKEEFYAAWAEFKASIPQEPR